MLTIKCFCDDISKSIFGNIIPQGQYGTNAKLRILQKGTIFKINFISKAHKTSLLIFGYVKTSDLHYTKVQKLRLRNDCYFFYCIVNLANNFDAKTLCVFECFNVKNEFLNPKM